MTRAQSAVSWKGVPEASGDNLAPLETVIASGDGSLKLKE